MDVIHLPKRAAAPSERTTDVTDDTTWYPKTLAPPCQRVIDALEAGIVSRRMFFPEKAPPRSVETWRAPIIRDKEIGTAIWSRLTELDAWMSPAQRPKLMSRILVLLAHYRSTTQADAVEQGIADDWAEDLAAYPMWAIDEAARTWRRTKKFKPQISEIIDLCEAAVSELSVERQRLQSIVAATARERNPLAKRTDELARGLIKRIG